jgi:hypothetical protein
MHRRIIYNYVASFYKINFSILFTTTFLSINRCATVVTATIPIVICALTFINYVFLVRKMSFLVRKMSLTMIVTISLVRKANKIVM